MKTLQEIFDQSLYGVRLQGLPSHEDHKVETCKYRSVGADGKVLKCGVGHLIPDDGYHRQFDDAQNPEGKEHITGTSVSVLLRQSPLFNAALQGAGINTLDSKVKKLLGGLQTAHDYAAKSKSFLTEFETRMSSLALHSKLTYHAPSNITI